MNKQDINLLLTIAIFLISIAAISFFGIRPLVSRFGQLRSDQAKTAEELARLEERVDTLGKLSREQAAVEELGRRAEAYLPEAVASGPFVMDIAAIAGQSDSNVPTVSFQTPDPKKATGSGLIEYPITVTAEGNFDQLKTFLRFLEENLRFSTYTTVTFNAQRDNLSMQLTGTIYSKAANPNPKDQSLDIGAKMKSLLLGRKSFGGPIRTDQPSRPDPFAEF